MYQHWTEQSLTGSTWILHFLPRHQQNLLCHLFFQPYQAVPAHKILTHHFNENHFQMFQHFFGVQHFQCSFCSDLAQWWLHESTWSSAWQRLAVWTPLHPSLCSLLCLQPVFPRERLAELHYQYVLWVNDGFIVSTLGVEHIVVIVVVVVFCDCQILTGRPGKPYSPLCPVGPIGPWSKHKFTL